MLQYRFSWKQLSVIAGISDWRFYFRLFNGSIKSPQIVTGQPAAYWLSAGNRGYRNAADGRRSAVSKGEG